MLSEKVSFFDDLVRVAQALGPWVVVALAALVLAAFLLLVYMFLRFGKHGGEMLMPYVRELLGALLREPRKTHPAIRLELRLTYLFAGVLFFCFVAIAIHALVPWIPEHVEHIFAATGVSAFFVCVFLSAVSVFASLRLP